MENNRTVFRYDVFELRYNIKVPGNPFKDYSIFGTFRSDNETVSVEGFYDGNDEYVIRFMPSFAGKYTYEIEPLKDAGEFTVLESDLKGPVKVTDKYHFSYANGEPYYSVGTTCYVWDLQSDERIEETFASLEKAGFNKIRFCIFPKHYPFNLREPRSYPYEGTPMDSSVLTVDNFWDYNEHTPGNNWDFETFNVEHFKHIEGIIKRLGKMNIEADIILFHPYDRWGFSDMGMGNDKFYLDYVIKRFSAYKNVWWSLANEFDILKGKTDEDWDEIGRFIESKDPYNHMRSIHQCFRMFDHTAPWITHASIQREDLYKTTEYTTEWRKRFGKPVVLDEIAYEGDIPYGWGNIPGEELTRRAWEGAMRGGYPGHGETFVNHNDVLWWSHGGTLHGESWKRFKFLLGILKQTPGHGLKECKFEWDCVSAIPEAEEESKTPSYVIHYLGINQPAYREFKIPEGIKYKVEVIDTWNMTVTDSGIMEGRFNVKLPGKSFMAIRMIRI